MNSHHQPPTRPASGTGLTRAALLLLVTVILTSSTACDLQSETYSCPNGTTVNKGDRCPAPTQLTETQAAARDKAPTPPRLPNPNTPESEEIDQEFEPPLLQITAIDDKEP